MNQFLAGLVERATLRVPVLERRPRSLFEPTAPPLEPVALDRAEQVEPVALDQRLEPPRRGAAASLPRPEPAPDGGPEPRSTRIASPPAEATPPPGSPASPASSPARHGSGEQPLGSPTAARHGEQQRGAPTAARHGELERVTRLETTPAPAPPLPSPTHERGHLAMPARMATQRPPTTHAAGTVHEPPRARSSQPPSADPLRTGPAPTARDAAPVQAQLARPVSGGSSLAPAALDAPPVHASAPLLPSGPRLPVPPALLARSQAGPRALQPNGSDAPPPAPVHVTIGRIEVRATAPAADRPPARRPPAGPRLTLENYLHGRRGGSR